MDRIILLLQHGDWTFDQILNGATFDSLSYSEPKSVEVPMKNEIKELQLPSGIKLLGVVSIVLLLILGTLLLWKKRQEKINIDTL